VSGSLLLYVLESIQISSSLNYESFVSHLVADIRIDRFEDLPLRPLSLSDQVF
jgi:hypothetical protein